VLNILGPTTVIIHSTSSVDGHRYLQSARRGQLDVPGVRLSTYVRRAFCHVGQSAWSLGTLFLSVSTTMHCLCLTAPAQTFLLLVLLVHRERSKFLADRTNGRAIGTVLRPSVVCLSSSSVTLCIVAKRCVLEQKLLLRAYRKAYMRNRLVPKRMTLTFV